MRTEAITAGFYSSLHHGDFPKIQILTIEGLLNVTEFAKYPDMAKGGLTFKKAVKESQRDAQSKVL